MSTLPLEHTQTRSGRILQGPMLTRRAGLAANRLNLSNPQADATALQLHQTQLELLTVGAQLSELLYELVPRLGSDKKLRREVLAVRRATQLHQPPLPAADFAQRLEDAAVAKNLLTVLHAWSGCAERVQQLNLRLHAETTAGIELAGSRLEDLRADRDFLGAVADASPDFAANPGTSDLSDIARRETRSIVNYAARAARKTSPFGQLTTVSLTGVEPRGKRQAVIDQGYVDAWLTSLSRTEATAGIFTYRVLDTGGIDPMAEPVPLPQVEVYGNITWKTAHPCVLRGYGPTLKRLQEHHGDWSLASLFEVIGGVDPFASFVRFLEAGILHPIAPWDYQQTNTWNVLLEFVNQRAPRSTAAADLNTLDTKLKRYLEAGGSERAIAKNALTAAAEQLLAARLVPVDRRKFQVYVDVASSQCPEPPAPRVDEALHHVLQELQSRISRRGSYQHLVQRFREDFGTGGQCGNAWRWLSQIGADQALQSQLRQTHGVGTGTAMALGPSMPLPNIAMTFQSTDAQDSAAVINQTHSGTGSLAARFAHVLDSTREQLLAWAKTLASGREAVEFVPSHEVNGLQAVSRGTLPRLGMPSDFPSQDADSSIALDRLEVHHDPDTDSLVLRTAGGKPLVPLYMGIVPAHLLSGTDRLLSVLADPWLLPRLGEAPFAKLDDPDRVHYTARGTHHGMVLRRARWTVPLAQLPDLNVSPVQLLASMAQWRHAHGIPVEVYARVIRAQPSMAAADRKPMWLDLTSAHCLALLQASLPTDALGVSLVEALPNAEDIAQGGGHAIEQLGFYALEPLPLSD